jgi:hypothetical protein
MIFGNFGANRCDLRMYPECAAATLDTIPQRPGLLLRRRSRHRLHRTARRLYSQECQLSHPYRQQHQKQQYLVAALKSQTSFWGVYTL